MQIIRGYYDIIRNGTCNWPHHKLLKHSSHLNTSQKFTVWCLELENYKIILKKLNGSEKNTKIFERRQQYLWIGPQFYYIQRSQKSLHTLRHITQKDSNRFLQMGYIKSYRQNQMNLKNCFNITLPLNIDKRDFHSTIS